MALLPDQSGCQPCASTAPGCVAQGGVPYKGDPGDAGAGGSNGINAFGTLTTGFSAPVSSAGVTTGFSNTLWMGINQVIFVEFAGYYQVTAILSSISATIVNLGYPTNAVAGTAIPIGATVSPAGPIGISGSTTGVTSVGLSVPGPLSVSGSPIVGAGTLTVTWAVGQPLGQFLATPSGGVGSVGLRAIVASDLPAAVTIQGNTFNGIGELVQLDGVGALPAVSGAAVTALNASNLASGTVANARLSAQVVLSTALPSSIRQSPTIQAASPLTATTVTFGTQVTDIDLFLTPAGTIATLTVAFPADADSYIGQDLWVFSTQIVTALTVSVAGGTIYGTAATALAAGGAIGYRKLAANVWFRLV